MASSLKQESNRLFARDAIGFTMGYHSNDYEAISWAGAGSSTWFEAQNAWAATGKPGMWNGNISLIAQGIGSTNAATSAFEVVGSGSRLYAYQYDQLNRLLEAQAWEGESSNRWAGATSTPAHHNTWTYDAAGNILTQTRKDQTGATIDDLTYHYGTGLKSNQLGHIDDAITTPPAVTGELEDQAAGNYVYDAIGNLISDTKELITAIEWDVRGKITKVTKAGKVIEYAYDALGQRIRKTVKNGLNENTWAHTYYVRDAQGNTLAVYSSALAQSGSQYTATLKVQEYTLYGASRLGTHAIDLTVSTRVWTGGSYHTTTGIYSRPGTPVTTGPHTFPQEGYISLVRGQKRYELANHLGNVLAVVSDRKLQVTATWSTAKVYAPDVLSYTDYYAFGWEMPGRSSGSYRYGFNGQEEETEFWGGAISFEYRVQDPRSGRFFSVDPIAAQYPWYTPYQVAGNMMIMARELEGLEPGQSIKSEYLNCIGVDMGSMANGIIDGIIGESWLGTAKFVYDVATDDKVQEQLLQAVDAIMTDPVGVVKALAVDKYESWSNVLNGGGDEDDKYAVGNDIGSLIAGLATGSGIAGLIKSLDAADAKRGAKAAIPTPKLAGWEKAIKRFGKGEVVPSKHGASPMAFAYESQISGLPEKSNFRFEGVDFDGVNDNVFLEAKGKGYAGLLTNPKISAEKRNSWITQASTQLRALPAGARLEWHFAEESVANTAREWFKKADLNVTVTYTPQTKFPSK